MREEIYAAGQYEGVCHQSPARTSSCSDLGQSHQNKFHAETLRDLAVRFASAKEGDEVSSADKDFWDYFSELYKHSNKGIKGRGKDRRICAASRGNEDVKAGRWDHNSCSDELGPPFLNTFFES